MASDDLLSPATRALFKVADLTTAPPPVKPLPMPRYVRGRPALPEKPKPKSRKAGRRFGRH